MTLAESIVLRPWREADLAPYAEMNADPEVMRYFVNPLTLEETRASLGRLRQGLAERGWGIWAVEVDGVFAGFTGLAIPRSPLPCMPCVEIGWRFRREFWGRGVAFAAAVAALAHAFDTLQLPELVSFTATANLRSRRLMERLGFVHNPDDDFMHPAVPAGHPLGRHVLYRKRRADPPPTSPAGGPVAVVVG